MARVTEKSAIIDGLLKLIALGGITATALLAPNAVQIFDKPLKKYFAKLDERERQRELQRAIAYMKHYRLITENYEHGLAISSKAKDRLIKSNIREIAIKTPKKWDRKWRIIFFDIPEPRKSSRDAFAAKIRSLGFKVMQRSVFVHPFSCREQVKTIAEYYGVARYVTYIVTDHLDNEKALIKRFKHLIK